MFKSTLPRTKMMLPYTPSHQIHLFSNGMDLAWFDLKRIDSQWMPTCSSTDWIHFCSGDVVPLQAVAAAVPLRPGKRQPILTNNIYPTLCHLSNIYPKCNPLIQFFVLICFDQHWTHCDVVSQRSFFRAELIDVMKQQHQPRPRTTEKDLDSSSSISQPLLHFLIPLQEGCIHLQHGLTGFLFTFRVTGVVGIRSVPRTVVILRIAM